ncbi:MAG: prolyl aminopeptidase [Parvularculaceae bacterium]
MPYPLHLFPPIEPYIQARLSVSDGHELYYEECGNPAGKPVLVVHGGPGGGVTPSMRRFFDPRSYRIILFDQRGCGRSTPHASLEANTTWHLVDDMERLREHLKIDKWMIFGGSWGSTLGLAYAQAHPDRTTELVLRGIFTLRREELLWFYQEGASWIFPDAWEKFLAPIPENERSDLMAAYYRRLVSDDAAAQIEAAKAWSVWEGGAVSLLPSPERVAEFGSEKFALAFARIECHYFVNGGFFERDDQLIANADRIRHIPGVIVQGRYDIVTPMKTAWELHRAWPEAELVIIDDAGHAASEPGIVDALVRATNKFVGK